MSLQLGKQIPTGPVPGGCGGATSLDAGSENCRVHSHSHG